MIRYSSLSWIVLLFGLVLWAGCCTAPAIAQQQATHYTFDVRDVPLDEALQTFTTTAQVGVIYTRALVAGKRTGCVTTAAALEEALQCILHLPVYRDEYPHSVLQYRRSSCAWPSSAPIIPCCSHALLLECGCSIQ